MKTLGDVNLVHYGLDCPAKYVIRFIGAGVGIVSCCTVELYNEV